MNLKDIIKQRHIRYRFINSLPEGSTVLDIGSGTGMLQKDFRSYRKDLRFISIDKEDYSSNYSKDDLFFKIDITRHSLPIDADTVDAVFSSHVLEHISSVSFVLKEIKRVLKPNGSVYIEVPSTRALFVPSFGVWGGEKSPFNFYDDPTHLRPFTRQSLNRIGEEIGLNAIQTGFARNWANCLLSPFVLPYSILKRNRQMMASILWSITGWCVYLWGKNVDKEANQTT